MKSFKEYTKTQCDEKDETTLNAEQLAKKIASSYNGRSNADVLRSILTEAEKSKRAGTLSNQEIDEFYNAFSNMLDSSQRKRLRAIVEKLKAIE